MGGFLILIQRENHVLSHSCDLGNEEAGAGRLTPQFKAQPGVYCGL